MNGSMFRATFYDSGIPQAIANVDGTIVEANEAFCNFLGYDDLCGHPFNSLLPEEDRCIKCSPVEHLRSARSYLAHKKYQRKDGTEVQVNVYYSALYEEDAIKFVLAQVVDISNEYTLELHLQAMRDEVERFAYIASHDLREPLSTVAGYASLLKRRCKDQLSESGQHWLNEILVGTERMAEKVDDLLAFSRAGRDTPRSEFSLGAAIEEGKRALARKFRETKGDVVIQGVLPMVQGDRSMAAQVFQNLFSNSLKYRKEDEDPRITVSVEPDQSFWKVSVSDNGVGFDSDQFGERIFEVFQRLYTVEQYPGTGIGLAISKKIIESHGGRIWVESRPEHGTTFHFTLPGTT